MIKRYVQKDWARTVFLFLLIWSFLLMVADLIDGTVSARDLLPAAVTLAILWDIWRSRNDSDVAA